MHALGVVLMIGGGLWAVLGAGNIVSMFSKVTSTGVLTFGLLFNGILFIFPGLVVLGIGALIAKRAGVGRELKPDRARVEAPPMQDEGLVKCPFCAELVKPEAIICRFCQRPLRADSRARHEIEESEPSGRESAPATEPSRTELPPQTWVTPPWERKR